MDDNFRPINDYPGYRVSSSGEVQSCWVRRGRLVLMTETWHALKPIQRLRYLTVNLTLGGGRKTAMRIHRLVLESFVGPCPEGMVCCHADGDPTNNNIGNLRWGTPKSNSEDKLLHGTLCRGEAARHAKLRVTDVLEIRDLSAAGLSAVKLAHRFGVCPRNVRAIVQGRSWRHLLPSSEQPGNVKNFEVRTVAA